MSSATDLRSLPIQTVVATVAGVPGVATPAPTPPIPHWPAIVPATVAKPDALFRHLVQLEAFLAAMWRSLGSDCLVTKMPPGNLLRSPPAVMTSPCSWTSSSSERPRHASDD